MRYVLALALFLSPAAFAKAPEAVCLSQCDLRQADSGEWEVACHCDKAHLRDRRLASLPLPKGAEVCQGGPSVENHDSLQALQVRAAQATRPLCECATTRSHFPLNMNCGIHHTGEVSCAYEPDLSKPSSKALRAPSREDYQACFAAKENYRRPSSCEEAPACHTAQPSCGAGAQVTNIADPEACCQVFVCQSKLAEG